mgnify:CR=1 FL=1
MKGKRKRHDPEFKARVALEALKGIKTIQEIAKEFDVHPTQVESVAGAYTPVPGGVGPLTIAMLMVNTIRAAESHCR